MSYINWREDDDLKVVLTKIGDIYEVIKYLGGGSHSKVYLVRHRIFDEKRALKVMDAGYILQKIRKMSGNKIQKKYDEIKERFKKEAKFYKKIKHPNIVKIYEVGFVYDKKKKADIPYLVMHYIKGVSLVEKLKDNTPLDLQSVWGISEDILGALDAIHQEKVIHRDIKPGNIMIEENTGKAVLIDFGLAKDKLDETELTATGGLPGTPPYMSPEQCKNIKSDLDSATDIYSFGTVLYEMMTGEPPFKSKSNNPLEVMYAHLHSPVPDVRKKNPAVPMGVEDIIFKAMAKKPEERYENAGDFLNALQGLVEDKFEFEVYKPGTRKWTRYAIYLVGIFVIAAAVFFITDPLGIVKKKTSGKPSFEVGTIQTPDEEKAKIPKVTIADKQRKNMNSDFQVLKEFYNGDNTKKEKLRECREFLDKHKDVPRNNDTISMVGQTNDFIAKLDAEIRVDEQYVKHIDDVNRFIRRSDYQKAADSLEKTKQLKNTDEVKRLSTTIREYEERNGDTEYHSIKNKLNLIAYLEFKKKYPGSVHIPDLKNRLKAVDLMLPPEKYWGQPIQKNSKGYYELTFGSEGNGHRVIYIPGGKIWIDKYEVSWQQFRRFLAAENREMLPKKSTKYIRSDDDFPAVVTYEDAQKYCKRCGMRLPRENEWEYAAGKNRFTYPWGNEPPDAHGKWRANFDSFEDGFNGTAPVKSFEDFSSPFGAVNMAGNVWEWVQGGILKGGDFFSDKEDLKINNREKMKTRKGFRCIKDEN